MARPDTSSLKSLLQGANSVGILLPGSPRYDMVAAALGLKLTLEAANRQVTVVCPDPMTVEFNRLVGVETITSSLGSRNLIISFPGQTEMVDKISYNLDRGDLQLVVTPKPGVPDLDPKKLRFSPGRSSMDLLIMIGVDQLSELGAIYQDARDLFSSAKQISLTRDLPSENYTPHQYFDPEASSVSELTAYLIESTGLNLSSDAASNLLAGLEKATNNFQHHEVSVTTFETAAELLRRGAKRHNVLSASGFPPGSIPTGESDQADLSSPGTSEAKEPPSDWYGPKVYKGPMQP